ncbi:hypothetical protein [Ottowia sp. VDI28]|uniref:hypothetical protein n=1 Tax=Ottowia sp. VDI28 TaxID=3133968 RepID=UPI003C2EFB0E
MTPSTLAASRQALLEVLRAVPAVGVVHDCEVYASEDKGFKAAYRYTNTDASADAFAAEPHIRGWYIRRFATAEVNANARILNEHTWHVRGYMSLKSAIDSELIFDELIERMRDAARMHGTMGVSSALGASTAQERGVQVINAGPVLFAGVLCHSAVLELKTRNWVEWRKS